MYIVSVICLISVKHTHGKSEILLEKIQYLLEARKVEQKDRFRRTLKT